MSLIVSKRVRGLRSALAHYRRAGETIGFVPTMGALHRGHLSLIDYSIQTADRTVCSIFVNPTQFNEERDLKTYPRTLDRDLMELLDTETDVLFAPGEEEIYPEGTDYELDFDFDGLDERMEGAHRPGHFQGVVQVVHRLLEMIQPDFLVLGQKDYQQWAILRKMAADWHPRVEVLMAPTVREEDGLALSSRNERLSDEMRSAAPKIYEVLQWIKKHLGEESPESLKEKAVRHLRESGLKPEYVELADGYTLLPVETASEHEVVVACAAAWADDVRLIDNVICKGNPA